MEKMNLIFYFGLGASGSDIISYDRISDNQNQSNYSSVSLYPLIKIVCKSILGYFKEKR